jgi:putative membrane protein
MFIDYLTLVMINLVAGTALLAWYLWRGLDAPDQRPYAAGFFGVGLVALVTGFHMSFTWPLPGSYNIAYSETTVLFGTVFLVTAIALSQAWNLVPGAIYAFFAGIYALLVGLRLYSLQMTKEPLLSAVGFILVGLSGIFAAPFLIWFRESRILRWIGIVVLVLAALLWAVTFYNALWGHMDSFSDWVPSTMGPAAP